MGESLLSPEAVAGELQISLDQLRRWTKDFGAQLSATAIGSGYFRYTAGDVHRLRMVRDLLEQGKTTDEVTSHLAPDLSDEQPAAAGVPPQSVVIHPDEVNAPAASLVLREVLSGFAAGQEAILNSQQANRNLMGVVIQDNFSLKEENARLRERMMRLEQELNEIKRQQIEYRAQIEQRFRRMEQKRDWLNRLMGF
jgi:DNA-binding transcriptional MerR regulator